MCIDYSRVPNKRRGAENNRGGLEIVQHNHSLGGGLEQSGGGVFGEVESSSFLS